MSTSCTRSKGKRYYMMQFLFSQICISALSSYLGYSSSLRQYTYEANVIYISYVQILTDNRLAKTALLQGL